MIVTSNIASDEVRSCGSRFEVNLMYGNLRVVHFASSYLGIVEVCYPSLKLCDGGVLGDYWQWMGRHTKSYLFLIIIKLTVCPCVKPQGETITKFILTFTGCVHTLIQYAEHEAIILIYNHPGHYTLPHEELIIDLHTSLSLLKFGKYGGTFSRPCDITYYSGCNIEKLGVPWG